MDKPVQTPQSRWTRVKLYVDRKLYPKDGDSTGIDTFIISLITLNVLSVMIETDAAAAQAYHGFFVVFEIFSSVVFTLEYLGRMWVAPLHDLDKPAWKARLRWAVSPMALIDLVAVAPFYLQFIEMDTRIARAIRMFRLVRILKMGRYAKAVNTLSEVVMRKKEELAIVMFVLVLLLILCSSAIYFVEGDPNKIGFSSIPEAMWWSIVTITSVGYGDVSPSTDLGKFVGGIICLVGVLFVALPTGILSAGFLETMREKKVGSDSEIFGFCPHCGEQLLPGEELE